MTTAPTFNQIKAQVAAIQKKIPGARTIGLHCEGKWAEASQMEASGQRYLIRQCDSPLAMRTALREGSDDVTRVLVTNLNDSELSVDILLRLRPRKLVPLDSWQIVKSLFQARTIDPRLTQHAWMAETLMSVMPAEGFSPVPSGFLDAETVWPILLDRVIGLDARNPDLIGLLKWSIDQDNVARFQAANLEFREAAQHWLESQAGSTVSAILACVAKQTQPDALPIGLALAVFLHPEHASLLQRAAGKMEERFLASQTLDCSVMAHWNAAANEIVRLQIADSRQRKQLLDRADEILKEVGAESHAWLSDCSPLGFEQRLVRFADRLSELVDSSLKTSIDDLLSCRKFVLDHERSSRERRRLERLDMATRLVQWIKQIPTDDEAPQSLSVATQRYALIGSFVDWARLSLRVGDSVGKLSQAYAKLFDHCTSLQEQLSKAFAELLGNYTGSDSFEDSLVHVEDFLDRVVAPLAAKERVLLIVMDGMSVAVARELMSDVTSREWVSLVQEANASMTGLAAIPSVTEISRASLLSGTLCQGDQNHERRQFEQHAGLNEQCRSGYPPVLFHKGALQQSDDTGLSADVRKEIGSSHRKIVGVVVNAVDDHLAKGEQIDTRWSRDEIRGLSALLHEARNAGRTVIFVSDHGHILENGTEHRDHEGDARWRTGGQPGDGELGISGQRVVNDAARKLILPWTEKLRYIRARNNGYHGGASPQEMVIPIAVLSAGEPFPEGWTEAPIETPAWWEIQDDQPTAAHPEPKLKPVEPTEPAEPPPGMLFPVEPEETPQEQPAVVETVELGPSAIPIAEWIKALLASSVFESQKQMAGRAAVMTPSEVFAQLLQSVDLRGGKITFPALARAMKTSPMRLRGYLVTAQRILNIDGYAVLNKDDISDTVQLDRDLLLKQFDLTE